MEKIAEVCPFEDASHPDTRAKIDEISRKIKSRSNSRAPSLAGQSRASSKAKLNDSTSSAEDQNNLKSIQPDDTDTELGKTKNLETKHLKNDYGKLETDDELEARKAWHESRFLKNVKMNKCATPKARYNS